MEDFFKITLGNVIAWALLMGGWLLLWQKHRDKVDNMAIRFDTMEKRLDNVLSDGPVASKSAMLMIGEAVERYHVRLHNLEDMVLDLRDMKNDIGWIKEKLNHK